MSEDRVGFPRWLRVAMVVVTPLIGGSVAFSMTERRGLAWGLSLGAAYAALILWSAVFPEKTRAWSKRHPLLDSALVGPLLFGALMVSPLPAWVCLATAVALTPPFVLLGVFLRQRRHRRQSLGQPTHRS